MSSRRPTIVQETSSPDLGEFGDFPYDLEPLTLPMPSTEHKEFELKSPNQGMVRAFENSCRRLLIMSEMRSPLTQMEGLHPGEPRNRLFRFRWITGHQVSFIVWRLLAGSIAQLHQGRVSRNRVLEVMVHYVHGYCGMLLYTGSCSREIYEKLIRPSMFLHHPGFSGSWALDFAPVRELLRGRVPAWAECQDACELRRAVKLSQLIHNGVAAKLVPNGRSL